MGIKTWKQAMNKYRKEKSQSSQAQVANPDNNFEIEMLVKQERRRLTEKFVDLSPDKKKELAQGDLSMS